MPTITVPELKKKIAVPPGTRLLDALIRGGVYPDAVCGGNGTCGKCRVLADGREVLACRTQVTQDMTVVLPEPPEPRLLREGDWTAVPGTPETEGFLLAFDIGTTSVVCFLLEGSSGRELAACSGLNPQAVFGADVVSRIRAALRGELPRLTALIREKLGEMTEAVCRRAGIPPEAVSLISVVGNPAMQQLFLGIPPENLASPPFLPVLTEAKSVPCGELLPLCPHARLLIVPDISGYVGADTVACLLATELYRQEEITLLVDIGTNGEMVLGNRERMVACAAAAGPALEGANIRFGMRAAEGAIDRVWLEAGEINCSVIGGGKARGICGSGLVDAVAVGLKLGLIDRRGRILRDDRVLPLTEEVYLTQEDIRQVQLAKGAVCAGIRLMTARLGLEIGEIQRVQLAGAFGSFLDPASACRIGLLPEELSCSIRAIGNGAGSGAKLLARDEGLLDVARQLTEKVEFLELAGLRVFPRTFAEAMGFREEKA